MKSEVASAIAQIIAAIGTVAVAILAIWGEKVRSLVAGPKIRFFLREGRGNLTKRGSGKHTVYYHLSVVNDRKWSPARNVRLLLAAIETKAADGAFQPERLVHPLQLTWMHPQFHELSPTITAFDMCDFGYLDEDGEGFTPSLYITPNDFKGVVKAGKAKRYKILAVADNFYTEKALVLEVSWDGRWTSNTEELMKHLVVKQQ